jgi:hypothetical protein
MSSDRRFEYEKGPDLEDEPIPEESDTGGDESDSNDGRDWQGRRLVLSPWKAGALSGASAFVVVFAVTYQLVGAMFAGGLFAGVGDQPSRWTTTGLAILGSHGATIEHGDETIRGAFGAFRGLVTQVTALVPVILLLAAAYVLVRYVRLETAREAGLALGSLILCYVVPTVGLVTIARWTAEGNSSGGQEPRAIAVAADPSLLVAIGGTAIAFVAIGAAVAALPRVLAATE